MKRLSLLLMIGTIISPCFVMAEDCQTVSDCASLGFTVDASKCTGSALKCPWDITKAACDDSVKTPLPILYGDGTVAAKIIKDKTPIGVVFDETNRLAFALTEVIKGYKRLMNKEYDIPELTNCPVEEFNICDVDGRANTTILLNCGDNCGGTPAATLVNDYQPAGCTKDFCKKTKWFLPSMRDFLNIHSVKFHMDETLTLLKSYGATTMGMRWYVSSNEAIPESGYGVGRAYGIGGMDATKGVDTAFKARDSYYIRPAVKY